MSFQEELKSGPAFFSGNIFLNQDSGWVRIRLSLAEGSYWKEEKAAEPLTAILAGMMD